METLEDLHAKLVAGDSRAASKIVEIALPQMVRIVTRLVPKLYDGHEDACLEAMLEYLVEPTKYDPTRAGLLTYLVNRAWSKASTAVRTQNRRHAYEHAFAVDREVVVGDSTLGEDELLDGIYLQQLLVKHWDEICPDSDDGEIFLLMAAGERSFRAYLEVLELEDSFENRAYVERRRERIRGRIRRLKL